MLVGIVWADISRIGSGGLVLHLGHAHEVLLLNCQLDGGFIGELSDIKLAELRNLLEACASEGLLPTGPDLHEVLR